MATASPVSVCRFGPFEFDLRAGHLRRKGLPIRLQKKPCSILQALLEQPGEIVTRTQLRQRLWPEDTFVDFEDGLNTAMRKLREALQDDSQSPRFIETVRGQGYRWIGPVEPMETVEPPATTDSLAAIAASPIVPVAKVLPGAASIEILHPASSSSRWHSVRVWLLFLCGMLVAGLIAAWYWATVSRAAFALHDHGQVLIADFDNQTGDPRFDNALSAALAVSLGQSHHFEIFSRLEASHFLRLMARKEDDRITAPVAREICQRGNIPGLISPGITRLGTEYLLTAQLIDPSTGVAVRSHSELAHSETELFSALDSIATVLRRDLGESRYEIHQTHRPLPEVTTTSLAALQDYADANWFSSHGRQNDALRLDKMAVSLDPGFSAAHAALGYLYYSFYFNQPEQGEAEYRKALSLSSRLTDRERARIEMEYAESQGRVADSLVLYRQYLEQYAGDSAARFHYARLLRLHGHVQESLPIYEQLTRQNPGEPSTVVELATAYSQLGLWPQAIQAYEHAFALDRQMLTTGNVSREYGFTLVRAGQEAKAEQLFSSLLSNSENYTNGERSLAFLDLYRGHYASARRHLELALAKSSSPLSVARIRYMLAVVAAGEGDRRESLVQLDRILAHFSSLGEKIVYGALLGQAYARIGEIPKARKILDAIRPLVDPRSEDQRSFLLLLEAEVKAASGEGAAALQMLKHTPFDDSHSYATLMRESVAHIHQERGELDQAIAWYRQFTDSPASNPLGWEPQQRLFDAYYTLALDYRRLGNQTEAIAMLQALLDHWQSADRNLPLYQKAEHLRHDLSAAN